MPSVLSNTEKARLMANTECLPCGYSLSEGFWECETVLKLGSSQLPLAMIEMNSVLLLLLVTYLCSLTQGICASVGSRSAKMSIFQLSRDHYTTFSSS